MPKTNNNIYLDINGIRSLQEMIDENINDEEWTISEAHIIPFSIDVNYFKDNNFHKIIKKLLDTTPSFIEGDYYITTHCKIMRYGIIDDFSINLFTRGECFTLAKVLAILSGGEYCHICDEDGTLHCVCKIDDFYYIDINGIGLLRDIQDVYSKDYECKTRLVISSPTFEERIFKIGKERINIGEYKSTSILLKISVN